MMKERSKGTGQLALGLLLVALAGCASSQGPDPWEPANRKVFSFNEGFDRWVMNPVADTWNFVFPRPVEEALGRALANLNMPRVFVNDLLQARPKAAAKDVFRFALNSSFGWAGLFDVAGDVGFPLDDSDFGQTLGVWGVPPGPYVTFPILGPFNVRDGSGYAADIAMTPWTWVVPGFWTLGASVVRVVNLRAEADEQLEQSRKDSLDYYVFLRDAYLQYRAHKVDKRLDGRAQKSRDEDLYGTGDEDYDVEDAPSDGSFQ